MIKAPADTSIIEVRKTLKKLDLGDTTVTEVSDPATVLINKLNQQMNTQFKKAFFDLKYHRP